MKKLKLHGFNNLTKSLSFCIYDICYAKTTEERDGYIAYIDELYNANRLTEILSEKSLYKRRRSRKDFVSKMAQEEEVDDLDREDVLRLNRIKLRFSKKQIEEFIEEHMEKDVLDTEKLSLTSEDDFEKLILAYDLSTRKNSKYKALEEDAEAVENNGYRYPALKFVRRHL